METGRQSACASYDQQSCCARKPPVTAKLAPEHAVVAEDTNYHAHQLVDHIKSKTMIIHIINYCCRKNVTWTICKSALDKRLFFFF